MYLGGIMIEVQSVSRSFGSFVAVNDISLSIQKGEIVGLLGPNGAGKTTTMRMLTGYLEPSAGTIQINGKDNFEYPKESKQKIGYMPESAPLYQDMITADYLDYVARVQGVDPITRIPELVHTCGLKEVMHKNISELSRGYRQRVGLAHALMQDPEILVLDEPTSGLDPNQIIEVRKLIKEIGKTKTVIISTHILGEVEMLCDRVIIISNGKIVADSPTLELKNRFAHSSSITIKVALCSKEELTKELEGIEQVGSVKIIENTEQGPDGAIVHAEISVKDDADVRGRISKKIASKAWVLYELASEKNSLEDVFRTLTTGGDAQ